MNNHKSTIRTHKRTPIALHFNSLNHTINHLSVIPIESLTNNSIFNRRSREYYWQLRSGTIYPKGLNNYPVNLRESTRVTPSQTNPVLETTSRSNSIITDFELLETLCFLYNT